VVKRAAEYLRYARLFSPLRLFRRYAMLPLIDAAFDTMPLIFSRCCRHYFRRLRLMIAAAAAAC